MALWLWFIIIPVALHLIGGAVYTVHAVRDQTFTIETWKAKAYIYFVWEIAFLAEIALNETMM